MQNLTIRSTIIALLILFLTACGGSSSDDSSTPPPVNPPVNPPATVSVSRITPTNLIVGQPTSFAAITSGDGLSYAWNFGDGQTGSGATPSHTYAAPGHFDVSVTVTNSVGATATATQSVNVSYLPISANIPSISPMSPSTGQETTFKASGTGQGALSYHWNFGDGVSGSGAIATHSYATAGNYTITLTVTDSAGQTATATNGIVVVNTPPPPAAVVAKITTISPTSPTTSQAITFTGTGSGGQGALSYAWNFGDGQTASGATTTHSYTSAGAYIITFKVTDSTGKTISATQSLTVVTKPPVTPPASATITSISPSSPSINQQVTFVGKGAGQGALSYTWNFGDGTGGTGGTTNHTYTSVGTYTVTLTVVDNIGQRASATNSVTVNNNPVLPRAVIESILSVQMPTLPFYAQTLITYDGFGAGGVGALTYKWDFGDGATATGIHATHMYNSTGQFTVSLVVTDSSGVASVPATATITVVPPPPPSGLFISPHTTLSAANNSIFLVGQTSVTNPLKYTWNFGDGSSLVTTNDPNSPTHTYAASGVYTVSMTAKDSFNQQATTSTVVVVPVTFAYLSNAADSLHNYFALTFDNTTSTLYYYLSSGQIQKLDSAGVVTPVAGSIGHTGYQDGPASTALFGALLDLVIDTHNGTLYIADTSNNVIRKISAGVVTTLAGTAGQAGSADGTGSAARFKQLLGITIDNSTGNLYVADNDMIRKVTPAGVVTTVAGTAGVTGSADGTGAAARFNTPDSLVFDPSTGTLYVSDEGNSTIRKISSTGVVTTLAGQAGVRGSTDGAGSAARFSVPQDIVFDPSRGVLYVSDNAAVRQITLAGVVTTTSVPSSDSLVALGNGRVAGVYYKAIYLASGL